MAIIAGLVAATLLSGCAANEAANKLEQQLSAAGFSEAKAIGFRIDTPSLSPSPTPSSAVSPATASPTASSQKSRVLVATATLPQFARGCSAMFELPIEPSAGGVRFVKAITAPSGVGTAVDAASRENPTPLSVYNYFVARHPECVVAGATPPVQASTPAASPSSEPAAGK